MTMPLGRTVERWWRERRLGAKAARVYGTRFPERVVLPETGIHLCIDPRDPRARKQILFDGLRGRVHRNARFWREACALTAPELCLDVGANFGECGLGMQYPPDVRVLVMEANPALIPHLESSRLLHPDAGRIEIVHALMGAANGPAQALYVNAVSSGRSTAVASMTEDGSFAAPVMVAARSVDSLLAERSLTPKALLFKVDVEGFEPVVLAGMARTLADSKRAVGYVEFDTVFLEQAGCSLAEYDRHLHGLRIHLLLPGKGIRMRPWPSLVAVREALEGRHLHTDMVLLRGDVDLPREWFV